MLATHQQVSMHVVQAHHVRIVDIIYLGDPCACLKCDESMISTLQQSTLQIPALLIGHTNTDAS